MLHSLKISTKLFREIIAGCNIYETKDNNFRIGDCLILNEFNDAMQKYTNYNIKASIVHIYKNPDYGLPPGYVLMYLKVDFDSIKEKKNE